MNAPLADQKRHLVVAGTYHHATAMCREKELPIPPHRTATDRTIIVIPRSLDMLRDFRPREGDQMHVGHLGGARPEEIAEMERWLRSVGFNIPLL